MTEFPVDSAIIATIISVSISIVVFLVREKRIEPQRWKRNAKLSTIEKQLDAYGSLLTLISACEQKATRQGINANTNSSHLIEAPRDSEKLREIFSEKRYLLSEDIINEYLKLEREDTTFLMSPPQGQTTTFVCNLTNMQRIAQSHFSELRKEYQKETGVEI